VTYSLAGELKKMMYLLNSYMLMASTLEWLVGD